jgi:hypothetical protein
MSEYERLKSEIIKLVTGASSQRVRPHDLGKISSTNLGVSVHTAQQALHELVREGKLIFTYRDPCTYVETPGGQYPPGGLGA